MILTVKPFAVQVDPIGIFCPFVLRSFHFDGPTHASDATDKHPIDFDARGRRAFTSQRIATV